MSDYIFMLLMTVGLPFASVSFVIAGILYFLRISDDDSRAKIALKFMVYGLFVLGIVFVALFVFQIREMFFPMMTIDPF